MDHILMLSVECNFQSLVHQYARDRLFTLNMNLVQLSSLKILTQYILKPSFSLLFLCLHFHGSSTKENWLKNSSTTPTHLYDFHYILRLCLHFCHGQHLIITWTFHARRSILSSFLAWIFLQNMCFICRPLHILP